MELNEFSSRRKCQTKWCEMTSDVSGDESDDEHAASSSTRSPSSSCSLRSVMSPTGSSVDISNFEFDSRLPSSRGGSPVSDQFFNGSRISEAEGSSSSIANSNVSAISKSTQTSCEEATQAEIESRCMTSVGVAAQEAELVRLRSAERRLTYEVRMLQDQNFLLSAQLLASESAAHAVTDVQISASKFQNVRRRVRRRVKDKRPEGAAVLSHCSREKARVVADSIAFVVLLLMATFIIVPASSWLGALAGRSIGEHL